MLTYLDLLRATSVFDSLYSDDVKAYLWNSLLAFNATAAAVLLLMSQATCMYVLEDLMSTNRIRLNPLKTQFI